MILISGKENLMKKAPKRSAQTLAAFLAVLVLMLCAAQGEGSGTQQTLSSPEDAENFVRLLLGPDAASLDGNVLMTPQMESATGSMGGFSVLASQLASLGRPSEIGPAYETVLGGMKAYRVPCRFLLMPLDIALAMDGDALAGLTTQPFTGDSVPANAEKSFISADLGLPAPEIDEVLPGTLTLPMSGGPFPAVVLVHGSGPCDRDETSFGTAPFRDIAESLPEKGIAVYRFDKRTYAFGDKVANDTDFTLMDESILDAVMAVRLLSSRDDIDPDRIFILGHSLGASAIPAIDSELNGTGFKARGYILMAPGARRLDVMMREQVEFLAEVMPESKAQRDISLAELDRLEGLDSLEDGDMVAGAYPAYWKWLFSYDILASAALIDKPCLLLQGEEDYQVTMEDLSLFREAVAGRDNWTLISYPGLTHMFTPGKKSDGPNAYLAQQRMDGTVLSDIADFILAH